MIPYGVWLPDFLNSQRRGAGTQAASGVSSPGTAPDLAPQAQATARPKRARPSGPRPSDNPADGPALGWLPKRLAGLYRALAHPVAYARGSRVKPAPEPEPDITPSLRERYFRVEIAQDAFCERRPRPKRLFRKPVIHRNLHSWCDSTHWYDARHRCPTCTDIRADFFAAQDGDWKAECRLYRRATRAARKLLGERREWQDTKRRQRAADLAEHPRPPPEDPKLFFGLGWYRWRVRRAALGGDRWFVVERREEETKLLRNHERRLARVNQRKRARLRDKERERDGNGVGRKSAKHAFRHSDAADRDAHEHDAHEHGAAFTTAETRSPRHCEDREPEAWRDAAIQGNVTDADRAALDRHAAARLA